MFKITIQVASTAKKVTSTSYNIPGTKLSEKKLQNI